MSLAEPELTDEQFQVMIDDPAHITSHDVALEVLGVLDGEIAEIQAQIDQAAVESITKPLSPERQAWLKRASYAAAMRRNERHRVMQRDKEIRGTKFHGGTPKDPEVGRLKQARLLEEAQARRTAKQGDVERERTRQMEIAQKHRELRAGMLRSALKDIAELGIEQGGEWACRRAKRALEENSQ